MIDSTNHTNDTPEQWARYAELLRRQPHLAPSGRASADMLAAIGAAASTGARRGWMNRWVMIPAAALMTVIAVMVVTNLSEPAVRHVPASGVAATSTEKNDRPRQTRRAARNRLPAPSIPSTPLPAYVDSTLVPKPSHFPLVDPVSPGGSRTPRSGGYRPGP